MWTPERGFNNCVKPDAQYRALVKLAPDGTHISFDRTIQEEVAKQCKETNQYYPFSLLNDSWIYPINFAKPSIAALFSSQDTIIWANGIFILSDCAIFTIHTPTLFTMMQPVQKCPLTISSADALVFYLSAIKIFLAVPMQKTLHDNQQLQRIAEMENRQHEMKLFTNLLGSGAFQNYFTKDRHPEAGEKLCKEFVQYTLRYMRTLERELLRLSVIGYDETTSENLCANTSIPLSSDAQLESRSQEASKFWKLRQSMKDMRFNDAKHPTNAKCPTAEEIENCKTFFYGCNLAQCEALLWYIQSRHFDPESYKPKQ